MADQLEAFINLSIKRDALRAGMTEAERQAQRISQTIQKAKFPPPPGGFGAPGASGGSAYTAAPGRTSSVNWPVVAAQQLTAAKAMTAAAAALGKASAQLVQTQALAKGTTAGPAGDRRGDFLQSAADVTGKLDQSIFSLVSKANPYVIERFDRAVSDLMALIGQQLIPVIDATTARVRAVADVVANLDPESKKLITQFGFVVSAMALTTSGLVALNIAMTAIAKHPVIAALTAGAGIAAAHIVGQNAFLDAKEASSARLRSGRGTPEDLATAKPGADIEGLIRERDRAIVAMQGLAGDGPKIAQAVRLGFLDVPGAVAGFFGKRGPAGSPAELERQIAEQQQQIDAISAKATEEKFARVEARNPELRAIREREDAKAAGVPIPQQAGAAAAKGGGVGGWGVVGDLIKAAATGKGPGGASSVGASFNSSAGITSVEAAFVDLTSKFLRLGSASVSPQEQLGQNILTEVQQINQKIGGGGAGKPAATPLAKPVWAIW